MPLSEFLYHGIFQHSLVKVRNFKTDINFIGSQHTHTDLSKTVLHVTIRTILVLCFLQINRTYPFLPHECSQTFTLQNLFHVLRDAEWTINTDSTVMPVPWLQTPPTHFGYLVRQVLTAQGLAVMFTWSHVRLPWHCGGGVCAENKVYRLKACWSGELQTCAELRTELAEITDLQHEASCISAFNKYLHCKHRHFLMETNWAIGIWEVPFINMKQNFIRLRIYKSCY